MDIKNRDEMNSTNTLPSTWIRSKIDEIAFVNPKNDYSKVKSDLPVTFVPMAAVDDISGSIKTSEILSFEEARKGHTKFLENDVIFARITPCMENGKIAIARNLKNGFGFGSTEFHVIRAKNGILPEYIYHYVRQERFRNFAAGFMTSTVGQLRVSKEIIESAEIPLAPTNEQKRITSKIEELFKESNTVCEALDKIPQILKKFRQSALAKAFRGELVSQDPNDEPAEKLLEKIKQERRRESEEELRAKEKGPRKFEYEEPEQIEIDGLPELPKNWLWGSIGMIETFVGSGITPLGGKSVYVKKGIPFIRSQNVYADGLHLDDVAFVTPDLHKEMSRTHVHSGDVLLNITGASIGRCTFVPENFGSANVNQHVCIIRTVPSIIPKYLSYWLNSPLAQDRIFATEAGVTREGLNYAQIRSMPIPITSTETQKKVITKIEELFSFADQIEKSVEDAMKRADRVNQAILAKAFRGELVPQDPNDEPASVLLERIKKEREKTLEVKTTRTKRK